MNLPVLWDVTTQAQIICQIVDIRDEYGVAVIMVTHNLGVASYVSNKLMVMKGVMLWNMASVRMLLLIRRMIIQTAAEGSSGHRR